MLIQKGQQLALKWTAETVIDTLTKIDEEARKETTFYLGRALSQLHISQRAWSYWKKKFADDDEIMELMDLIEGVFEVKLFEAAIHSELPAAVAIFALKNNHHWTDRPDADYGRDRYSRDEYMVRPPMLIELDERTIVSIP